MIRGYELLVRSAAGAIVDRYATFTKLSYTQAVNAVGTLEVSLSARPDYRLIGRDCRIEVWVSDDGRFRRDADTQYLVSGVTESISAGGEYAMTIKAVSALDLLRRRATLPHTAVPESVYNGAADDTIKLLCMQSFGTANEDTTRLEAQVTVDAYTSAGPIIDKEPVWRNLLQACQEIAKDAEAAENPVYFDVVLVGDDLRFRTWVGARGQDRTSGPRALTVSPMGGTLIAPSFTRDWSREVNRVYGLGSGQGVRRAMVSTSDGYRGHLAGPFALREAVLSVGSVTTDDGILAEAASSLKEGRPTRTVTGNLADTSTFRYGREWGFGDKILAADMEGETVACVIASVQVTVSENGPRSVKSTLRAEDL